MPQPPVVLVPGITASRLDDFYRLPPEKVWDVPSLARMPLGFIRQYERVCLHPDDLRYELAEPARVGAVSAFSSVYGDLVEELRANLSEGEQATPVYPFGYDWRLDCALNARLLADFVDEVIQRSALLPHYRDKEIKVDIVAHSMGGLIVADYLRRFGQRGAVRRVVSLGSPFGGAVDAVLKLIMGKGQLTGEAPRDREREMARITPSLYELLPGFEGAVQSQEPQLADLFDPAAWQPSLIHTLQRFIQRVQARTQAEDLLAGFLNTARLFRGRLARLDLAQILPEGQEGWLALAGVGYETQVAIKNQRQPGGEPRFEVLPDQDAWSGGDPESPHTGDGTVPFLGAVPPFLAKERLICVCPADLSRWELVDRVLVATTGLHGFLPVVNLVQRIITRFLRPDYKGEVWAWKPPTVPREDWTPPDWLERRYK